MLTFESSEPEIKRLRIQPLRPGQTRLEKVARRGNEIIATTTRGTVVRLNRMTPKRSYAMPHTRWMRDVLLCCVDLGVVSREAYQRHQKRCNEIEDRHDRRRQARCAMADLEKLNVRPPAKLRQILENNGHTAKRKKGSGPRSPVAGPKT